MAVSQYVLSLAKSVAVLRSHSLTCVLYASENLILKTIQAIDRAPISIGKDLRLRRSGARKVTLSAHAVGLDRILRPSTNLFRDGSLVSRTLAVEAIWLILPVVICLSQRLSHARLSTNFCTVKLRMAHYIGHNLLDELLLLG